MQPDEQREQEPRILNGRFRLQSQLAKGGMGVTYRAWDLEFGRPVVVKMPKRALFDEPGFLERFDREVRATIALDHPSIVRVIDHGADAGEPFLVMQFLPGGSLAGRISQHTERGRDRMPASHLHAWLPRIAAALDHAHASGVLHRDIKPANIFFDAGGLAYLGDFGIAKILEDSAADTADPTLTGTHIALGTHAYMAPERLAPRAVIDGRADQYALAICVFEAITGTKPFRGDTMNIVIEQATLPPPDLTKLRPDIPASACQAVAKALAKRPADRFETCSDFAAAMLAEIPPAEQEAGFAWLQCPACSRLVRLPEAAAGRTGRCPRCKAELVIAHNLEGLWLPAEYAPATLPNTTSATELSPGPAKRFLSPRALLPGSAIALLLPLALLLIMPRAPDPPSTPAATAPAPAPPPTPTIPSPEEPEVASALAVPSPTNESAPPARNSLLAVEPPAPPVPMPKPPESDLPATVVDAPAPIAPEPADVASKPEIVLPTAPPARADDFPKRRDAAKAYFDETVRWVLVDGPRNESDPATGRGAVDEPFYIAQYELTNADYCVFLNASHAGRTNAAGIGDRAVATSQPIPGIRRIAGGDRGDRIYAPLEGMGTKPATLTANDAVRLANWLHRLYRDGTDNTGAEEPGGSPESSPATASARGSDALFFIPTLDDWFKAAYFKGGKPRAGYWRYPTATNEQLVPISGPMPDGRPALRGVETTANFGGQAIWAGTPPAAAPTDVGANGAPSAFGAFDMAGNVAEWATATVGADSFLIACGGDYESPRAALERNAIKAIDATTAASQGPTAGLRLARSLASTAISLSSDSFDRRTKAAAYEHLRKANAAVSDKSNIFAIRTCSAAEVRRLLGKLLPLKMERSGAEADVNAALERITAALESAEQLLRQREAEMKNLLPAATMQQPVSNVLEGLTQVVEGVQAQLDVRDLIQRYDEKLAPLQAQVSEGLATLNGLRAALETKYGKP